MGVYSITALQQVIKAWWKVVWEEAGKNTASFLQFFREWTQQRLRLGKHQDSRESKTNCFPRDLTLSV